MNDRADHRRGPSVRVDLASNEFVRRGAKIRIEFSEPVDLESADEMIRIDDAPTEAEWNDSGTLASVRLRDDAKVGPHRLEIDVLRTAEGEVRPAFLAIAFVVTDTAGDIPDGWLVRHLVRLRREWVRVRRMPIGASLGASDFDIVKLVHRTTGKSVVVGFDATGTRVDPADFHAETRRRREIFGKLAELLVAVLEDSSVGDAHTVGFRLVAPRRPFIPLEDEGSDGAAKKLRAHSKRVAEIVRGFVAEWSERLDREALQGAPLGPVAFGRLTADEIRRVAASERVVHVDYVGERTRHDIDDSIDSAHASVAHVLGFTGAGINVGVWDATPQSGYADAAYRDEVLSAAGVTTDHPTQVCAMLKHDAGAGNVDGHAPGCTLFAADVADPPAATTIEAAQWAVQTKNTSVLSKAFHFEPSEEESSVPSILDQLADELVYEDPLTRPLMTFAAGNGSQHYVVQKAYNGLVVANHRDNEYTATSDCSRRNPESPHQDRELPEIAANGNSVHFPSATGLPSAGGTSLASPVVGAAVAIIQEADSELVTLPEACRAIVLASGRSEPDAPSWWRVVSEGWDAEYDTNGPSGLGVPAAAARTAVSVGAGGIDTGTCVRIAKLRRAPHSIFGNRGWDVQDVGASNFDATGKCEFVYGIRRVRPGPMAGRVALAWRSGWAENPWNDDWDLDLELVDPDDGSVLATSASFDNNYEIMDFALPWFSMFKNYEVVIRLGRAKASPAGSADTEFDDFAVDPPAFPTRFGIAWRADRGYRTVLMNLDPPLRTVGDRRPPGSGPVLPPRSDDD